MSENYKQGGRGVFSCEWMNDAGMEQARCNTAYFAALDPQTVLELIKIAEGMLLQRD